MGVLAGSVIVSLTYLSTDGLIDKLLEGGALVQTKITAKLGAKSLAEPCLLLSVGGYLFSSITC